ncbi:AraC family ligand binding domain-containing protein [Pseudomonas sp. NA-150]|uniref:AraC family transcriptional regulator n=1 Tax=Pseudomonas sp. NA-150 TaxID=3367525 RepID=UPI0037CB94FD
MNRKNTFHYYRSEALPELTLLDASITDFYYKKHVHQEYAFGVILGGEIKFDCRDGVFQIPRGGLLQLNPDDPHEGWANLPAGYQHWMLYIPQEKISRILREYSQISNWENFRFENNVGNDPRLRRQFVQFVQALKHDNSHPLDTEANFLGLVDEMSRLHSGQGLADDTSRPDTLVLRVKDFIQDHLHTEFTLDQLSAVVNMSKYHFLRLFKQQVGITPYQYTLNCRINAVRRSLEGGLDLHSASAPYHFYDSSHLNRRFKEVYGTTPMGFQRTLIP